MTRAEPTDKCSTPPDKPVLWWAWVSRRWTDEWVVVAAKNWSVAREMLYQLIGPNDPKRAYQIRRVSQLKK